MAVEALWDSFDASEDCPSTNAEEPIPDQLCCVAISKAAAMGFSASCTIRLSGIVAGIPALILVDSGSSTSFVSESLASQLSTAQLIQQPTKVQVAGAGFL